MLRLGSVPRLLPLQSQGYDRAGTYKHHHEQIMAHVSSYWMWHSSLVGWWRFCKLAPPSVIRHVGLVGFVISKLQGENNARDPGSPGFSISRHWTMIAGDVPLREEGNPDRRR